MRLIHGHDAEVKEWVAARISHVGEGDAFGPCTTIGVADDTRLLAGIVYHNYVRKHATCEISFAADTPRWATRENIRGLLSVPFEQYDCRTVNLLVPFDAERVRRFVKGIGFVRRGLLPDFFDEGRGAEIYSMTRRDYAKLRRRIG